MAVIVRLDAAPLDGRRKLARRPKKQSACLLGGKALPNGPFRRLLADRPNPPQDARFRPAPQNEELGDTVRRRPVKTDMGLPFPINRPQAGAFVSVRVPLGRASRPGDARRRLPTAAGVGLELVDAALDADTSRRGRANRPEFVLPRVVPSPDRQPY